MKKLFTLFALMLFLSGFAQDKDGWQDWEKTSCYSKIMFRLKYQGKNGTRHIWKVQFRSEYDSTISFNYRVGDDNPDNQPTTHRKVLYGKAISAESDIYADTDNVFLIVDKVSLSAYPQNFITCE